MIFGKSNISTTDEFSTGVLKITLGQKRSTFVSRNRPCENFFITYPPAWSNVYQNTHFLLKKQKLLHKQKAKIQEYKRKATETKEENWKENVVVVNSICGKSNG